MAKPKIARFKHKATGVVVTIEQGKDLGPDWVSFDAAAKKAPNRARSASSGSSSAAAKKAAAKKAEEEAKEAEAAAKADSESEGDKTKDEEGEGDGDDSDTVPVRGTDGSEGQVGEVSDW